MRWTSSAAAAAAVVLLAGCASTLPPPVLVSCQVDVTALYRCRVPPAAADVATTLERLAEAVVLCERAAIGVIEQVEMAK